MEQTVPCRLLRASVDTSCSEIESEKRCQRVRPIRTSRAETSRDVNKFRVRAALSVFALQTEYETDDKLSDAKLVRFYTEKERKENPLDYIARTGRL